ncbi:hypothetical protein B0A55_02975 [Friedmanniomyces simplex]|uniref:Major facilitator superfamily (MFS) profile domain-containing protein n=1 Tax=Friedmanniomyces simplex TaxID=329884 RepID=A0A4U0Y1U1_9PEZI|nr:hypothetical protein B0A55_02975 [Friedmanniomyces simplex]
MEPSPDSSVGDAVREKQSLPHREETAHEAAERGHAATDRYGRALVHIDPVAERKLRLKIDLMIVPTVSLLYLFCYIDRANIGNAKIAGFDKDLGLEGYDYNIILSVFYISYIIFEIPSNVLCKAVGPGWFIPTATLLFGITSLGTAFVHNRAQACGVRFLLGIFESSMLPSIAYYLSRWYRRSELAFRLSLYIVMAPLAGAFGGLLASGILKLSHFGGLHSWRMVRIIYFLQHSVTGLIFAIEGIITCGLALISYGTLTDRPATAKWLTPEECDMAIARVKSERVGTTEILDKLNSAKLLKGFFSPVTLGISFIFLLDNITAGSLAFFLPTIIKTIYPTNTVIYQQLRTVPPYVVGGFFTVLFPFLSWKFDRRQIFFIISAPFMMTGYIMFLASTDPQTRYGATFLITAGAFSFGALCNAQVSANVVTDTARASAIGTNVMVGNLGGLVSTWAFLPNDAPDYHTGNGLNLATSSLILVLSIAMLFWMQWNNKARERRDVDAELAGKDDKSLSDLDWKHPSFRWRP